MNKRLLTVLGILLLAATAITIFAARGAPKMENVIIVPVGGNISTPELEFLVQPIEETFGATVSFATRTPLPAHAYNRQRGQYLSGMVLDALNSQLKVPENDRVLAVTNEDLYVPDLNFVFGQADIYTGVAIISLARLRPEFYGQPNDESLFHARAITEAVHELGHTLGITTHCPDPKCVMHFSNSLADTDIKGHRFCFKCRRTLQIEPRK